LLDLFWGLPDLDNGASIAILSSMGNTHSGELQLDSDESFAGEDPLDSSGDMSAEATLIDQGEVEASDTAFAVDVDLDQLIHDNQIEDTDVTAPGLSVAVPDGDLSSSDQYILGVEHLKRRDWAAAAEALQASVDQNPGRNAYHSGRGVACLAYVRYRLGDSDEAIRLYREAIDIDPSLPGVRSGMAAAFARAGASQEAIESFNAAIHNDPNRLPLHFNLGNLLARMGRLDEAEAAYRVGLRCEASHAALLTNLGAVLAQQNKFSDAIASLRIVCDQEAPSWRARFNLGLVLARSHRWSESIDVLRQLVADYPQCPRTRILTARVMRCGGLHLEAIDVLDEFVEWGDWRPTAQELLGLIHESLGNPVQAVVFWKEAMHGDPQFARPLGHLALQALREGEIAEAAAAIDKALAIREDSPKLWTINGQIDLAREDVGAAVKSLERAVELNDAYEDARYWLGRAYLEAGSIMGALGQYERLDAADSPLASRLKRRIG
jgi:tetratricopeptide (TPR) repeat protein